jgi:hypothetical protein
VFDHAIRGLEGLNCVRAEPGLQVSLSLSSSATKDIIHASLLTCIVVGIRREFAIHLNLPSIESWVYPVRKNRWIGQLGGFS